MDFEETPDIIFLQIEHDGWRANEITWCADMIEESDVRYIRADIAYDLSTWAAGINWDGSPNQPEWLDGLRERIKKVQEITQ